MKYPIILLCLVCLVPLSAQNTDSLWAEYKNESLSNDIRLKSLHRLAQHIRGHNPDSAFRLSLMEQEFAQRVGDSIWLGHALNLQGGILAAKNDFAGAMDKFYRLLELRTNLNDTSGIAGAYNNIGNIYYYKGDYPTALEFYIRSLQYEELDPTEKGLAASFLNIGSVYALQKDFIHAREYFERALNKYIELKDDSGIANCYSNLGNVYKSLKDLPQAKDYFLRAIALMKETGNQYGLATAHANLAKVYLELDEHEKMFDAFNACERIRVKLDDQLGLSSLWISRGLTYTINGNHDMARKECGKALRVAESLGVLSEITDACDCLYRAYKGLGMDEMALTYFERHSVLQDSLAKDETKLQLQVMEFRNQVKEDSVKREAEKTALALTHQKQLTKGKGTRNLYLSMGIVLILVAGGLYMLFHKARESRKATDEVLLNILPASIAEELMKTGKVEAQEFGNVTILFTDIVGFTQVSARLPPQQLMDALNEIYSYFDEIMSKYGIEKIKSIGDAYMAAGGLPVSNEITVKNTVLAALEIQDFMHKRKEIRKQKGLTAFDMRVGVHTGPVVAGIIGVKKFHYDVWGDTVNTANRMETNGEAGRVNISSSTYEFIKDDPDFIFEQRTKIPVKGKGEMQMYFVNSVRSSGA